MDSIADQQVEDYNLGNQLPSVSTFLSQTAQAEYQRGGGTAQAFDYGNQNATRVKTEDGVQDMTFSTLDRKHYTELEPMSVPLTAQHIFDEIGSGNPDLMSWKDQDPIHWSARNVMDFIYYLGERLSLNVHQMCGEKFRDIDGPKLCSMALNSLEEMDPQFGRDIYNELEKLKNHGNAYFHINNPGCHQNAALDLTSQTHHQFLKELEHPELHSDECLKLLLPQVIDFDFCPGDAFDDINTTAPLVDKSDESGYDSSGSGSPYREGLDSTNLGIPCTVLEEEKYMDSCETFQTTPLSSLPGNHSNGRVTDMNISQKRGPGRPRRPRGSLTSNEDLSLDDLPTSKKQRGRKPGQMSKGNHLWEFIRDLLKDPQFNPLIIRWENQEEGVFRIVKSCEVSKLWGKKKNNTNMNYEKLSRAMRHYYKSGILHAVLGRRLVYKFGPKARDWKPT